MKGTISLPAMLTMALACALMSQGAGADSVPEELQALSSQVQELSRLVRDLSQKVEAQQVRIEFLEQENRALKAQSAPRGVPPAPQQPVPALAAPVPSGVGWEGRFGGLSAFNPEIGGLADITAVLSESDEDSEGNDKISVREIELIIGHDVDPFGRFDSTITLSDFEDVAVEEAYMSLWDLPWDLKARLGRVRPKIGKASAMHRDTLDTADEPLVIQNYLGVEGLFRTAAELSWFIPAPWEIVTHELTAGVMEGGIGEGGTLFGETRRIPSYYVHLKNFWDISDVTNFELGGTYLLGSSDEDSSYEVNALGLDATLIHYVTPTKRLKIQAELYYQDRDEPFSGSEDEEEESEEMAPDGGEAFMEDSFQDHPWGMYTVVDYRLTPRFSIGGRWDYVIPTDTNPLDPEDADWAASGYLTFHQTEFTRWRLQYQHVEFMDGKDDDRVFVQGTFIFGVHKHQLQ